MRQQWGVVEVWGHWVWLACYFPPVSYLSFFIPNPLPSLLVLLPFVPLCLGIDHSPLVLFYN